MDKDQRAQLVEIARARAPGLYVPRPREDHDDPRRYFACVDLYRAGYVDVAHGGGNSLVYSLTDLGRRALDKPIECRAAQVRTGDRLLVSANPTTWVKVTCVEIGRDFQVDLCLEGGDQRRLAGLTVTTVIRPRGEGVNRGI